jgi:hypothetical protein
MQIKIILIWFLALAITLLAVVYQRVSGPTYPRKVQFELDGKIYKVLLPRSNHNTGNCKVSLNISDRNITGFLIYRRIPSANDFDTILFTRSGEHLVAELPGQPAAGKLQYLITLKGMTKEIVVPDGLPVIIRFSGVVPSTILIPHVLLMFLAMFFANMAGLTAIFKQSKFKYYSLMALVLIFTGGMILGPVVQKYAFGDWWTGIPFGWDLTDNKTLVAFLFWLIAVILNWRKERRFMSIIAAVITIVVFSIPHSLHGSQLDYNTGKVRTGITK